MSDHLKPIIEALIFASPEPITRKVLYKLLDGEPKEDVDAALDAVMADYTRPGGLQVVEVAGGYQIVTRAELHDWVRKLLHERTTQKLSVASLETLSVVAYKQPITQAEIGEIRGGNTSRGPSWAVCGLINVTARAGAMVMAFSAEITVDTAIVRANWL